MLNVWGEIACIGHTLEQESQLSQLDVSTLILKGVIDSTRAIPAPAGQRRHHHLLRVFSGRTMPVKNNIRNMSSSLKGY
jgi:hypothetical protein